MSANDRRARIALTLQTHAASVEQLAAEFKVSPSTIRRDLERLTSAGRIHRTYGGAVPAGSERERSLLERELIAGDAKRDIGQYAAAQVQPGTVNLLDAGTTVGALAGHLVHRSDLTVVTNGMTSARLLEHADGVELILLGGLLRHISSGTVGPIAEATLRTLTADAAFLGADSVDPVRGLSETTHEQASLKREMLATAERIYVLADANKLSAHTAHWWAAPARPWHLITDTSATTEQLAPFRARTEITVHVVPSGDDS